MSWRSYARNLGTFAWQGADVLRRVLHLIILLLIFSVIIQGLSSGTPNVPASAALYLQPAGALVDQKAGDPFERALDELAGNAEVQVLVQDIVDALAFAKEDDRISSVVLDLSGGPGGGLSKFERVAAAIRDFRESGKPVVANADFYFQGGYYLAAQADEVYLHPDGLVSITGFGAYQNYFKDAIDNSGLTGTYFASAPTSRRSNLSCATTCRTMTVRPSALSSISCGHVTPAMLNRRVSSKPARCRR